LKTKLQKTKKQKFMRDSNRLKEKYEVAFDGNQIFGVTLLAIGALVGTFFLGVVVGKKLNADAPPSSAPVDLLSQADAKTKSLDALTADANGLTFQDELTKKLAPLDFEKVKPGETPKPLSPVADKAEAKPEPPRIVPPEPKPLADLKAVEIPVEPALATKTKEAAPPKETPAKHESEAVSVDKAKPEVALTKTNDAGALKDAFGKAQRQVPDTTAGGKFTLQLSAYQDKGEADKFIARLRDKGYAPFTVESKVAGKGTWYRVRMGQFGTREAATRYLSDLKRETSLDAFVTSSGEQ
jgi:DedD protein